MCTEICLKSVLLKEVPLYIPQYTDGERIACVRACMHSLCVCVCVCMRACMPARLHVFEGTYIMYINLCPTYAIALAIVILSLFPSCISRTHYAVSASCDLPHLLIQEVTFPGLCSTVLSTVEGPKRAEQTFLVADMMERYGEVDCARNLRCAYVVTAFVVFVF